MLKRTEEIFFALAGSPLHRLVAGAFFSTQESGWTIARQQRGTIFIACSEQCHKKGRPRPDKHDEFKAWKGGSVRLCWHGHRACHPALSPRFQNLTKTPLMELTCIAARKLPSFTMSIRELTESRLQDFMGSRHSSRYHSRWQPPPIDAQRDIVMQNPLARKPQSHILPNTAHPVCNSQSARYQVATNFKFTDV